MRILRRRVSTVVIHNNHLLGFHAEDPSSGRRYFFIPGGRIEEGESASMAAVRETLEETGYQIEVLDEPKIIRRYDFEWDGVLNDCETVFVIGRLLNHTPVDVDDASYHRGVAWIPLSNVAATLAYHDDIREPVEELCKLSSNIF